jgi:acetylxylan esterase
MVKLSASFAALATVLLSSTSVLGASLQQVTNLNTSQYPNPNTVGFYIYVPDNIGSNPALLVAAHYCGGTANAFYSGTTYKNLADVHKFIIIYPQAPDSGGCWDVGSTATLKHDAGGDSKGIASFVRYAIATYGVNTNRVYATGTSSGAMMTQVLMGAYPDLFKGGASFAGVPYGCFASTGMWNSDCANGVLSKTAQQWGDLVRSGYPGFSGTRPKVAVYHGTSDEIINYNNHLEAIKQWTNVFGYSSTPSSTVQNSPVGGWTRSIYGPNFHAISAQGVVHNIPVQADDVVSNWFSLASTPATTSIPSTTQTTTLTTSTKTTTTSTPTPTGNCATKWSQCGGKKTLTRSDKS